MDLLESEIVIIQWLEALKCVAFLTAHFRHLIVVSTFLVEVKIKKSEYNNQVRN